MKSSTNILHNHLVGNRFACIKAAGGVFSRAGVIRRASFITVAAWVRVPIALYDYADVLQAGWIGNGWDLSISAAGLANFGVATGGAQVSSASSASGAIKSKNWYRLVGTYDNDRARLYLGGVLVGTGASAAGGAADVASNLTQESADTVDFKDLMIWSRALTADEVSRDAKGQIITQGLTGYWPCDDGTSSTLVDVSGYGHDITIPAQYTFSAFNPFPGFSHELSMADLYTITLKSGTVLRYTNFDRPIKWAGNTFLSGDVRMERSDINVVVGVAVDELTVNVSAKSTHLVGGIPFLRACHQGVLDGGAVKLERAFLVPRTSLVVGTLIMFSGIVGPIQVGRISAVITVHSDLILLNTELPRNVYQPGCVHTLFDSGCTLSKAAFRVPLIVASGSTTTKIRTNSGAANGNFDLGSVQFTSGTQNGVVRSVKSFLNVNGEFTLTQPLLVAPTNGDTMDAYPGCDKLQTTCTTKFSNVINFRGYPYVPAAETIT